MERLIQATRLEKEPKIVPTSLCQVFSPLTPVHASTCFPPVHAPMLLTVAGSVLVGHGCSLRWVNPRASLVVQMVKNLPVVQETQVRPLGQEDPLEKGMTTHSSILAWRIPWTEEPGGLQSMGSQRAGHN